ncbi:MAG: RNA polymerase subunit sigma-24 [Deltaproteobacteria bacterium HGW-Deltaproteobacteria-6]|jgi:RNA polymerase sigma-70 factor (ECF subfamily)|nr:MAG: RNA polymerase subunit sigma-24 [Deltaproteobacteria bacterium HGW-Deltaproteobacteria-6]
MAKQEPDFKKIHDTYAPRIRHYLEKLAGVDEADDLTQETFAKVSRSLKNFRGQSSLWTWLYKIATNTAIDRIRKNKLAGHDLGLDVAEEMADQNVWTGEILALENHVIRREMNSCIRDVVSRLPEACRTVIVLSEFEGLKNEDIAVILGLKLETVKIRLHRARLKLKEALSKQCILYRDERNEFACEQKHDSFIGKDRILSLIKK